MRYVKILIAFFVVVFAAVGLFQNGAPNFSDAIVRALLGTLLFTKSIEYYNDEGNNIRFYLTFILGIIAYLLAFFAFFP